MRSKARQSGFTLIEMLVVIAVLGLIIVLLSANGPPRNHWLQTRAAAQKVAMAMRQASTRAIISGHEVTLALPTFPAWMAITMPEGNVMFAPDGSANGRQIALADANRQIIVTADWLTGRPMINEP